MSIDDKVILGTPVLNFSDVDREHNDLAETLAYADSTGLEIRGRAQGLLLALNELKEQRRAIESHETEILDNYVAWVHYKGSSIETCDSDSEGAFKVYRQPNAQNSRALARDQQDLLELEDIVSGVVDLVNIWNRESYLPEIQSAGQIAKAIDKLWAYTSYRDVIMQSTLSSIAANTCCGKCQEAAQVAKSGLRAAQAGELLWITRKPSVDLSKFDAQGNAKK